ncbi:hypothetical protein TOPH_04237 [Tolypocladium ophioglossoides CBS 100239]|uniref:Uncharacterized protein n=1 Tax=Tolypocladium ophioglossoides (strain CBS 100239) TaxID=1163406 RepID=A0A0L0NB15_TOLOC|nr:hypothetical protein TOPH_04237 [Tolypocladium ophioglossoides CBS 100239]
MGAANESARTCVGDAAERLDPFPKADLVRMNLLPHLVPLLHGQVQQRAAPPGQQDARLLEALPHRAEPIRRPVLVPPGGVRRGHLAVVEGVQVSAGEDVRRRKRRRRLDAVQQQDLIGRRQQQHGRAGARLGDLAGFPGRGRGGAPLRQHDARDGGRCGARKALMVRCRQRRDAGPKSMRIASRRHVLNTTWRPALQHGSEPECACH